ncbi:GTPase, partial [Streptococcus suis]
MEEIFSIGCGAQIQTQDKAVPGFTPQTALEKG